MVAQNQQYQPKQKLNEKEAAILEYIKKNENEPKKLTINQVASTMDEKGISSRLTTNKIIFNLMDLKIIKDEKIGNKFHRLKINDEYYYDTNKLEEELLKSQIQKALEPFKTLLESKKMEVHIINKTKGKTDVIIGIQPIVQKIKSNEVYIPKPLDKYPTDDVFTPQQLQNLAMDQQKKTVKQLRKDLMDYARKETRDKTKLRRSQK
jgi:hypothetical protein